MPCTCFHDYLCANDYCMVFCTLLQRITFSLVYSDYEYFFSLNYGWYTMGRSWCTFWHYTTVSILCVIWCKATLILSEHCFWVHFIHSNSYILFSLITSCERTSIVSDHWVVVRGMSSYGLYMPRKPIKPPQKFLGFLFICWKLHFSKL